MAMALRLVCFGIFHSLLCFPFLSLWVTSFGLSSERSVNQYAALTDIFLALKGQILVEDRLGRNGEMVDGGVYHQAYGTMKYTRISFHV